LPGVSEQKFSEYIKAMDKKMKEQSGQ